jgi:hypothetical protein
MKPLLFVLTFVGGLYCMVSCTKTNNVTTTVRDTTVLKDTTFIRDTTVQKDTITIAPKVSIVGVWAGSYFINGAPAADSFYYQFDIRNDGLIYSIGSGTGGGAGYASGPWTLTGTTFSATLTTMNATIPENVQTITCTYDSAAGTLTNGVWIDTQGNGGQTGTFTMSRLQ